MGRCKQEGCNCAWVQGTGESGCRVGCRSRGVSAQMCGGLGVRECRVLGLSRFVESLGIVVHGSV